MKNHEPFFSIIIPTYNRASLLPRALDSLRMQSFRNFEVLIVDDGSTDNTRHVVTALQTENPNLRYFYKENEERSIARNFGIAQAKGAYIGFLDSDDLIYPDHLAVANALLEKHNFPEVGHLGYELKTEDNKQLLVRNSFDETFKKKLIYDNILHGNAIFVRADVASTIQFIPSRFAILGEDWYVWLRLAARYSFHFDNRVTSAVIHHESRSLLSIDPEKLELNTHLIVDYLKRDGVFMRAFGSQVNEHFAGLYSFLALTFACREGKKTKAVRYLFVAVRYSWKVVFQRRVWATIKLLMIGKQ
jgi:glycosyltransferase involved in cell wall biosynthesis